MGWRSSQITLFFKSFLIPMSKLLNAEAENGVIIFNSGLLCHYGKNGTLKIVVMRKKERNTLVPG